MANGGQINYSIGFNIDQSQLNHLKASLQQIKNMTAQDLAKVNFTGLEQAEKDLQQMKTSVAQLEGALNKAFNKDLGTLNLKKFNGELQKLDLKRIYNDFNKAGEAGRAAFRNTTTEILTTNMKLKQSNKLLDDMARTMKNTVKWGIASSVMNTFSNNVQQAYGYVKHLDSSLNDIRIVTGYSADEMDRFAEKANKAAKNLAASTTDYTEAALIYYQQGLAGDEVEKRAETTLKTANVTGQSAAEVSEQLTAVWNGYKVSAEETEVYVDKLAAVAASTASDLEELSTGMSKVASAASTSGVDIDQLSATLSTVISVTRQAPESVGTAFKTIYARLGDLAVDGVDEFGTSLGQISSKMKTMGIEILDETGNMRDMGTVVEEVAAKWDTWSSAQKQAAAVAMAGKRQYNNLIALFENWDMYESSLQTSQNSLGTLSEQQEIYLDSAEARLQQLKTSMEGVYDSLLDADTIKEVAGGLTFIVSGFEKLIDGIGGGSTVLLGFGAIFTKIFSNQLTKGIYTAAENFKRMKNNFQQMNEVPYTIDTFISQLGKDADKATLSVLDLEKELSKVSSAVSEEEYNELQGLVQKYNEAAGAVEKYNDKKSKITTNLANFGLDTQIENFEQVEAAANRFYNEIDGDKIVKGTSAYDELSESLQRIQKDYEETITKAKDYQKAQTENLKVFGETEDLKNARNKIEDEAITLKDSNLLKDSPLKGEIDKALREYYIAVQKAGEETTADVKNKSIELAALIEKAGKEIKNTVNETKRNIDEAAEGAGKKAAEEAEEARQKIEDAANKVKQVGKIQLFVDSLQGLESLAFGITSIVNGFKVLGNESLSTGEKMAQFTMAMLSGLPMVISGLGEVNKILQTSGILTEALTKAKAAQLGVEGIANALIAEGATVRGANIAAIILETGSEEAQVSVKKQIALLRAKEITGKEFEIAINGILAESNIAVGASGLTAAAGMEAFLASILPIVGPILILVGVLGGLYLAYKKFQVATDDSRKAAESLQTTLGNLSTGYTELQDSINELKEQRNTINSLKEGTEEWNEAIDETTNKVLDLIEKYPELAKYVEKTQNGGLGISDVRLDEFQKEYKNRIDNVRTLSSVLGMEGLKEQAQDNRKIIGNIAQDQLGKTLTNDQIDKLIDGYKKYGANIPKDELLSILNGDQVLADIVKDKMPEIAKLIAKNNSLIEAATLGSETNAKKLIEAQSDYDKTKVDDENALFSAAAAMTSESSKKYREQFKETKKLSDEDKLAQYADITGAILTDSSGKKPKFDIGGQEQEVSWDVIEKTITTNTVMNDVAESWKEIEGYLDSIRSTELAKEINGGLAEIIASNNFGEDFNINKLTQADIENIANKKELTAKDLGITDEDAKKQGYTSGDAMAKEFLRQIRLNSETIFKDTLGKMYTADEVQEISNKAGEGDFKSIKQLQDLILADPEKFGLTTDEDFHKYSNKELFDDDYQFGGLDKESRTSWSERDAILEEAGVNKDYYDKTYNKIAETAEGRKATTKKKRKSDDYEIDYDGEAQSLDQLKKAYNDYEAVKKGTLKVDKDTAEKLKEQAQLYEETKKQVEDLAAANIEMNTGFGEILDNFDQWSSILNNEGKKGTDEYAQAMEGLKNSMAKVLNIDPVDLSDKFITDNLDDIQAAANGDIEALERLRAAASKDIVAKFELEGNVEEELNGILTGLQAQLDDKNLEVGATLDDSEYIDKLNEMMANGELTKKQVNKALNAIGYEPKISWVKAQKTIGGWPKKSRTVKVLNKSITIPKHIIPEGTLAIKVPKITGGNKKDSSYSPIGGGGGGGNDASDSPGGTGGGGGGGSTPEKTTKTSEEAFDPFREVNNSLSKLTTEFDRLSEKQEKLFGKDLLDNLNKQLDVLEQQVSVTKEKLSIAEEEARKLRENRKTNYKDENGFTIYNDLQDFGIQFDENGEILNGEILKNYDDKIKAKEAQWNAMSAGEQAKNKNLENEIAALNTNRDTLKSLIEEYDELLYDTIPDIEDEIVDAAYQQFELKLESFQLEADLRLDISEAIKDWKDFKEELGEFEFPEDLAKSAQTAMDALNAMKEMDLDNSGYMGLGQTLQRDINNLIAEQDAWRNNKTGYNGAFAAKDSKGNIVKDSEGEVIFDEQAFMEAAQENMEELQDYILQQEEYLEQIHDNYLEGIEAVGESYEEQLEVLEYMGEQIEHNIRMTELLKGEEAYDDMATYYQIQITNLEATLAKQKESADYYKEQMNLAIDEEAKEKWREMYLDTLATYEETLESIAETVQAEFENFVQQQLQTVDEIMGAMSADGKYLGTSYIKSEWEIETGDSEEYLDLVERTYGIQNLANKIQASIAETDSLSAQKKLNSLLDEQLEKLREKDKLTQYDLDRAEALYEIELKKIALEEAQNNKSQMRLRRDSSGNYSYQFVADEENVSQAQQDLLDAQNSLYELDRDTLKEKQEEIISTQEEMYDLITEFSQLSAEERIAKEDEYMMRFADLQQRVIDLGGESAEIQNNLAQSAYDAMSSAYTQMGEDVSTLKTETMLPQWVGVMDEMIAKINGPEGSFKQAWDEAIGSIMNKDNETQSALDDIEEKSNDAYNSATESAQDWMASAEDTTEELKVQVDQLKDLNTEAEEYKKWWDDIKQSHVDALATATEYYNLIRREEADKIEPEEENNKIIEPPQNSISAGGKTNTPTPSTPSTPAIKKAPSLTKGSYVDVKPGTKWYYTSYGASPWGYARGGYIKYTNSSGTHPYNIEGLGWIKKDRIVGYATGGYTGDWAGQTGKLAMLHKKEMVLNSKDTENMLKAVKLLREFANGGNSQSSNRAIVPNEIQHQNIALKSVSAMTASIDQALNKLISSLEPFAIGVSHLTKEEKSDTINIEINADFPNANSAKEIEKAFLHLTNIATQRAHSTKK